MINNIPLSAKPASKKKSSNGRWTKTEHQRFMKALEKFGRDWVSVQKFVKTRSLSQVRSHAQKVFLKMSDFDIQALIAYEGDSDYEIHGRSFYKDETAKPKESKMLITKNSVGKVKSVEKTTEKPKESLLDIFKRAIELETLEIYQDTQQSKSLKQIEKNSECTSTLNMKLQEDQVFEQNSNQQTLKSNVHSRKFQNMESQMKLENQDLQLDIQLQQMQFILPDLRQFYQQMPTLTH